MRDEIKVTFSCKACGANPTALHLPDNYTDDDIATCEACGTPLGRYGDLRDQSIQLAFAERERLLRKAFGDAKRRKMN